MIVEIFLFVIVTMIFASMAHKWIQSSENFPPGPLGLPLLGYLPFLGKEPHKTLSELSRKYGDIFSIYLGTTRVVIINKTEYIREAGKRLEFSGRPKMEFNVIWGGGGTDKIHGLLFTDGQDWSEQRRFTMRHLKSMGFGRSSMEELILHEVQDMLSSLEKNMNKSIDVDNLFEFYVVNALWKLISGKRLPMDDRSLIDTVDEMSRHVTGADTTGLIYFFPKFARLFPSFSGWKNMTKTVIKIRKFCMGEINSHKETFDRENTNDFIDIFMKEMNDTKDENSSFYGKKGG